LRDYFMRDQVELIPSCYFMSFAVSLVFLLGCGGEPKHPGWKNATGAEQYERLMWQAMRDKDWKEVEYHLAPAFVGVTGSGQALDRAGWVEHWRAAAISEFSLAEVSVQPNGADMTVAYVLHLRGEQTAVFRVVSVWQQVKGGWILIAASTTPMPAH
jgi:hypothetical protein